MAALTAWRSMARTAFCWILSCRAARTIARISTEDRWRTVSALWTRVSALF
ncbi:unnamed protein product [Chondrus crispus]|uniref:Uncharacterized protein n=1 Tax=Chondrus crispus TaxID=2769 RepID=R7QHE6_CHOCR|nr:unnamed protein product [Chondrus crispus]CDF36850.1 unnamed protein product [Chondrus crispus]|eukprot:XP_005716669.1 unnamed protein product [Chondrus crispus]